MAVPIIRALDSRSASANSRQRALARALVLFREAARRVPAYKDFLKKHRINPAKITNAKEFASLPTTDKPNYITKYSLEELSWDGSLSSAKYVSTSSGSTGIPFFWPRGERQDTVVNMMVQRVFEDIFDSKKGSTLFVDSFALGTWIAGLEFYNAAKWTSEHGNHVVTVTPGIDREEAIRLIRELSPLFDRVVIGGYPPFVKDIIEHGGNAGIRWKKMDTRLLVAGEAVSELWKSRILAMIGKPEDGKNFVSVFGMADSGIVAHETPLCSLLRKCMAKARADADMPDMDEVTGLYQYYPTARYFEGADGRSLVLTSDAGLPLIRYDTRDAGVILSPQKIARAFGNDIHAGLGAWNMPFVALFGRKDLSVSFYALQIYVEHVKRALEHSSYATSLSGLFTISVSHTKRLNQQFNISVELARGVKPSNALAQSLTEEMVATLCRVNSEYAKLLASIGRRAKPKIKLLPLGEIATVPGKKHKWVKRR